jgi:alpha-glucuronidase
MHKKKPLSQLVPTLVGLVFCISPTGHADDGSGLWLKYRRVPDENTLRTYRQTFTHIVVPGESATLQIVRDEIKRGLDGLLDADLPVRQSISGGGGLLLATPATSTIVKMMDLGRLGSDGYLLRSIQVEGRPATVVAANTDVGLLYGAFALLSRVQTQASMTDLNVASAPRIQRRLLNHWDNLDGSIERGYAGRSLWKWNELPQTIDPRYRDYARANASLGINGTVVNNVNASPALLTAAYIEKVRTLADIFRPYGIRVFLSIRFSSPLKPSAGRGGRQGGIGDLDTADPLDPQVRRWWAEKANEIYRAIPDFGGFLVKANSEGMPGPQDYDRTHAEGANMLAEALAPHGGIAMWRAFVYDDVDPDRAKRSYKEFVPLDGKFASNVFVQAKNGPVDFQPREPAQPLFGAMPKTPIMLELQITQEYLGHSKHLVYLAPMWKECLHFDTHAKGQGSFVANVIDGTLHDYAMTGIAGVANTGSDTNWSGHLFAQANWYAFGRLAWDHTLSSEAIADEWVRMTLSQNERVVETISAMMLGSHEACVNYMTPLGLHHIMQEGFHYGPQPSYARASRLDWTSVYYHRADANGVGFDRSSTGSNATSQYFSPLREQFDDIATCPERYLLWFHHTGWDHKMASGRTLWQEMQAHYDAGIDYVKKMQATWQTLKAEIDPEIFAHVTDKLDTQLKDATIWRDTCIAYFKRFVPEGAM